MLGPKMIRVGTRGNSMMVTIPRAVKRKTGLLPGDYVYFIVTEEGDILIRSIKHAIEQSQRQSTRGSGDHFKLKSQEGV